MDIQPVLRDYLNELRDRWSQPLVVVSGARCPARNAVVSGAKKSLHLVGLAADIRWPTSDRFERQFFVRIIDSMPWSGKGRYPSFVHLDLRHLDYRLPVGWFQ